MDWDIITEASGTDDMRHKERDFWNDIVEVFGQHRQQMTTMYRAGILMMIACDCLINARLIDIDERREQLDKCCDDIRELIVKIREES